MWEINNYTTVVYRVRLKNVQTKTAISHNLLNILLQNFVQLFSRVDCIKAAHF